MFVLHIASTKINPSIKLLPTIPLKAFYEQKSGKIA